MELPSFPSVVSIWLLCNFNHGRTEEGLRFCVSSDLVTSHYGAVLQSESHVPCTERWQPQIRVETCCSVVCLVFVWQKLLSMLSMEQTSLEQPLFVTGKVGDIFISDTNIIIYGLPIYCYPTLTYQVKPTFIIFSLLTSHTKKYGLAFRFRLIVIINPYIILFVF